MKVSDFTFDLPEELIAQDPLEDRSSSRLLTLDKNTGEIGHDAVSYTHLDVYKRQILHYQRIYQ